MLQVSVIDLVIVHSPYRPGECFEGQVGVHNAQSGCGDLSVRVDPGDAGRRESWRALETTVRRGLVRAIGLSDYNVEQLRAIVETATIRPAILQTGRSLSRRQDDVQTYCMRHGITVQSWGPLGSPILGAGFAKGPVPGKGPLAIDFNSHVLLSIAAAHAVSPQAVALRWVVQNGSALVVGTGNSEHMVSNSNIFGFKLTPAEMATLNAYSASSAPHALEIPATLALWAPQSVKGGLMAAAAVLVALALLHAIGRHDTLWAERTQGRCLI